MTKKCKKCPPEKECFPSSFPEFDTSLPCIANIVAVQNLSLRTNNQFSSESIILGNTVTMLVNNTFLPGAQVVIPDINNGLIIPGKDGLDKNTGLREALRSGNIPTDVLRELNGLHIKIDGIKELNPVFLPSWATSFTSNGPFDEKYNGPYEPNNLYCIESLDENSVFTIDSSLDNVIIVANCIVSVAAGLDLNNVIICSTAFSENPSTTSIRFLPNINFDRFIEIYSHSSIRFSNSFITTPFRTAANGNILNFCPMVTFSSDDTEHMFRVVSGIDTEITTNCIFDIKQEPL